MKIKANKKTVKGKAYITTAGCNDSILRVLQEVGKKEINVATNLTFEKRSELVRRIASFVFIGDGNNIGDYAPEYTELSKRLNVIGFYTDFDLPKEINDVWLVLTCTSLYEEVVKRIADDLNLIYAEADALIESKKRYLENKTDLLKMFEGAADRLGSLGSQFTKDDVGNVLKLLETLPNYSSENIIKAIADIGKKSK